MEADLEENMNEIAELFLEPCEAVDVFDVDEAEESCVVELLEN